MEKIIRKPITVELITPIKVIFNQPLTDKEYSIEIRGVLDEICSGARRWAYSCQLVELKQKIKIR